MGVIIFILTLLVIELSFYAYRMIQHPDRAEVRKRLRRSMADDGARRKARTLSKKKVLSDVPFLNQILSPLPGVDRLDLMIKQANVKYTLGFFILFSMTLGFTGYLLFSF